MSRRPTRFTQAEVQRAMKAALALNVSVVVEIPMTGPIRIIADPANANKPNPPKRRIAL